jgi:hypothetical protein
MSGVAAMPTWRFVTDNEMGRPAIAAPTGEETVPMPTICSISECGVAARELRHHRGGAAWTQAGRRHSCSTTDGRA